MKGTVTVVPLGDVKIHSYTAPAQSAFVTSQIIETPNKVIIVDAQFVRPFAREVKRYVKWIGKPVERVIVSHAHPDHYFGLEFFTEYPIYAAKPVITGIDKYADVIIKARKKKMGELITSTKVVANKVLKEGTIVIDGLKLSISSVKSAESGHQTLITLPEYNVLIAQDFVYNMVHLFTAERQFDIWISALEMIAGKKYKKVFVGHGLPADHNVIAANIDYLKRAKKIYKASKNGKDFQAAIIAAFPSYKSKMIVGLSASYLFKKGKGH